MKNTIKDKLAVICLAGLVGCSLASARDGHRGPARFVGGGDFEAGIGYMENSERAFGFIKGQGVVYQDEVVSHKLGLEFIGYDETLDSGANIDLLFATFVLNYEVEYEINPVFSVFGGVGFGAQYILLDSPIGELDDDLVGYAQLFVGARAHLTQNVDFKVGVRRMFFDDYELLGISDLKEEQTWAFDAGFTFRF